MSFDIFDAISDATKEADAFENHPAKELSLEERLLYLQGLALVMNADKNIHDEEKEYLRILIKSLEMDEESILEMCVAFAQAPDKDTIQAFFRAFRRKSIAQLFLFDAFVISRRDGQIHDKKTEVINKIAEQLEILVGTQLDIYYLFCYIENRRWDESAVYFDSFLLDTNHFKHLLAYYEMDYDELMAATIEMRQDRLLRILRGKVEGIELEWESLRYGNEDCLPNATSITTEMVKLADLFQNPDILIPYLQSRLNRGELRIYQQQVDYTKNAKEGEGALFNLDSTGLLYDAEMETLSLDNEKEFIVPEKVLEDLLLFIVPELISSDVSNINIVIKGLFGAEIATSKLYSPIDADTSFPLCGDGYIEEVLMHHDGYFITSNGGDYIDDPEIIEVSPLQLLINSHFRLMK